MSVSDTTAEAHQIQLDIFRRMGPHNRLQKALELTELSRQLLAQGVRQRHPGYSEEEIRLAVIRYQLPEELFLQAFPHFTPIKTMSLEQTLKLVIEYLEAAGIEYMITGSFASNLHGVPRTTQDADIIIELSNKSLERLISLTEDAFYISEEAAKDALRRRDMFNVIHFETAFKVDLIVRKQRAYAEEEFRRKQPVDFLGQKCWFASPEDTILSKLEWSKKGQSDRQYQDALGVAEIQGNDLDWDYLQKWADQLGVRELCNRLMQEVGPV